MKKTILLSFFSFSFFMLAIAQSPTYSWGKKLNHYVTKMDTDTFGNIYTVGNIYDSVNVAIGNLMPTYLYGTPGRSSAFISKYDANGNLIWGKVFKSDEEVSVNSLAISPNGKTIALGGSFSGTLQGSGSVANRTSQGDRDAFVARFNDSGELKSIGSAGAAGTDYAQALHYDKQGHLYFMYFIYVNGLYNINVIKYNKVIGQPILWQYNTQSNRNVGGYSIGVDKNSNVYFMVSYQAALIYLNASGVATQSLPSSSDNVGLAIIKLNGNGTFAGVETIKIWMVNISSAGMVVNPNGDVYASGNFRYPYENPVFIGGSSGDSLKSVLSRNSFIVKYNSSLSFQWVKQLASDKANDLTAIKLDKDENVFIAGYVDGRTNLLAFKDSFYFGNNAAPRTNFLLKYSGDGNLVFNQTYLLGNSGRSFNICFSPSNDIYYNGYTYVDTLDLNPGAAKDLIIGNGEEVKFLTKQSQAGIASKIPLTQLNSEILIYPNPTVQNLTLRSDKSIISAEIIDLSGKSIFMHEFINNDNTMSLPEMPNGIYVIKIITSGSTILSKVIKQN
jgi:hypothetical protein